MRKVCFKNENLVEVIIVENWKKYNGDSEVSMSSCACNLIWVIFYDKLICNYIYIFKIYHTGINSRIYYY